MSALHKVVWAEGVFLGQQHFQLWDRYLERAQLSRCRSQNPFHWGLIHMRIDESALANGQLRLVACELIFPDGRLAAVDATAGVPLVCDLTVTTADRVEVFLALPANDGVSGIAGYQDKGRLCAWQAEFEQVADEHDPGRVREVMVGRPNLLLLRGDEPRDQFTSIKIAELVAVGDGGFRFADEFIPTVCHIGASPKLKQLLQGVLELVQAKVRLLSERRRGFGALTSFGPNELGQFLLLQTLRPALAALQHLCDHVELHPERLYCELARLVAGLLEFHAEQHAGDVPAYVHGDLSAVFTPLRALLGNLLSDAVPTASSGIELRQESQALNVAQEIDPSLYAESSIFLAVLHATEDPGWVIDFTRQAKVGAREDIELILSSALPGIRLVHTQRPPSRLPIRSGYEYFRLEPHGEFWQRAREHRSLAVFLPTTFREARLELLCVKE